MHIKHKSSQPSRKVAYKGDFVIPQVMSLTVLYFAYRHWIPHVSSWNSKQCFKNSAAMDIWFSARLWSSTYLNAFMIVTMILYLWRINENCISYFRWFSKYQKQETNIIKLFLKLYKLTVVRTIFHFWNTKILFRSIFAVFHSNSFPDWL